MEAPLPVEPRTLAAADRPTTIGCPIRAAAVRIIARTRLAWVTEGQAVSTARNARPTLELKASRALDNQSLTGD
jgi:hypothetical protein